MNRLKKVLSVLLLMSIVLTLVSGIAVAKRRTYVVTTGRCHIRKGPDKNSEKYRTAKKGEYFLYEYSRYDNRGVEWYGIMYGSAGTAWISSANAYLTYDAPDPTLTPTKKPTPTPKPTPKPINYNAFEAVDYYVKVTGNSVYMRSEPATDRSIVAVCSRDDVLRAMRTNGSWTQVLDEENNNCGYIYSKYLEICEAPAKTEEDMDESIKESFGELQSAANIAALIDVPEDAINVTYRWNQDMQGAEIYFKYEGVEYILYEYAGRPEYFGGDFGDANEEIDSGCNLGLCISAESAQATGYSAQNDASYALMGPSAENGKLVVDLAKKLFPQDCV